MTVVALRELAFQAIANALAAALPEVPVERNRRTDVDFEGGEAPRLVVRDGGHDPDDGAEAGFTMYQVGATVEGHATAATDADLGAAVNALYLDVAGALFGKATIAAGGFELWLLEGRFDVDFAAAPQSDRPAASFFLQVAFQMSAPTGAPSSPI